MSKQDKHSTTTAPSSATALKASLWYIASTFITKGLSFLSTPIYARLMTKAALGSFANLASYLTIVSTVTGCDFHTSIIRSKYDFEGDLDSYAFSVLTLNYLIVGIVSVLGFIFRDFIFDSILHIDKSYGIILILYLLLFPAYNIFATLQRVNYRYKVFSALSLTYAVSSVGAVLLLLNILPNGLTARVVGQYGPIIVIGFALSLYLSFRGKTVRLSYWKYALTMCLPLLPHLVSIYGMSGIGKMVVRQILGEEATAVFAIAYSGMHILSLLVQSANQGWAPWMLDMIHTDNRDTVRRVGRIYVLAVMAAVVFLILVSPELILFLGGSSYMDAVSIMPTLLTVCLVQMLYMVYLQPEFYEKKVASIGLFSTIAALATIVLCVVFTRKLGMVGTGWAVLMGYGVLFLLHYFGARRLGYGDILEIGLVVSALAICILLSLAAPYLYMNNGMRLTAIVLFIVIGLIVLYKLRLEVISFASMLFRKK